MSRLKFRGREIHLPKSPTMRILIGIVLVLMGFVGFLPIVGFWMIPLGLVVLSIDVPPVRRARRRLVVWWERRQRDKIRKKG